MVKKKQEIYYLIAYPLLVTLVSYWLKPTFFFASLMFLLPPCIWFATKQRPLIPKISLYSLALTLTAPTITAYIIIKDGGWHLTHSIFPFRFLHTVPLELFLFTFFFTYFVVSTYSFFFEQKEEKFFPGKTLLFVAISLVLLGLFFAIYTLNPQLLQLNYASFWIGTLFLFLPGLVFIINHTHLLTPFLKTTAYFFYLGINLEIVNLQTGLWSFPGIHFLARIPLPGAQIPVEILIFVLLFSPLTILSLYEFFLDDRQ